MQGKDPDRGSLYLFYVGGMVIWKELMRMNVNSEEEIGE